MQQALISLAQSFCVHQQAFGLAACVICPTMLQQYTTFGCQPREEAEVQEKANLLYTAGGVELKCPNVNVCCVTILYEVQTKNE